MGESAAWWFLECGGGDLGGEYVSLIRAFVCGLADASVLDDFDVD